ncbi:MAG: hypothetical protein ACI9LN_004903, partial [Saprospiraceae bacterium]
MLHYQLLNAKWAVAFLKKKGSSTSVLEPFLIF